MEDPNALPSLEQFPRIPVAGKITVAESHSELHSLSSNPRNPATGQGFAPIIANYNVVSRNEIIRRLPFKIPSIKMYHNKDPIMVAKDESVAKAIWDAWREGGLNGVYLRLSHTNASNDIGGFAGMLVNAFTSTAALCIKIYEAPSKILGMIFPHLEWTTEDINDKFSRVRSWNKSWIRTMEWHPNYPLIAIALKDDSIRLFFVGHNDVPMLRSKEQLNISCISWRPIITTEIAVGCEDCIVIWYLTSPASMKLAKDKTEILKVPGHGPITCVEYSPNGLHLLSASAKDPSVYMWDTYTWTSAPLRRFCGGGIPLSLYSPEGDRFLAASPTNAFWIWEVVDYWECKRWNTPKTMIEAACWSPDGSILLFATDGIIYGIFFELSPVDRFVAQTDSIVKRIYNIEECHMLDEDENLAYKVGGKVRHMVWDNTGHRVAVMFDDSEMIAVFRVMIQSRGDLLAPLGFIRGHEDEYPLTMQFQKSFMDGALLAIAWNSGRLQYFPLIFALPKENRNMLHEDNYRAQNIIQGRPLIFAPAGFASPRVSVGGEASRSNIMSEMFNDQNSVTSPSRLYSLPRTS